MDGKRVFYNEIISKISNLFKNLVQVAHLHRKG